MSNKDLYLKLCEQKRNELPVFMQAWWLNAACENWDVAIAKKGDLISGAWAYPVEKKLGVPLLRTPLLTPYLGPRVFYPEDIKDSNRDTFEHETIAALIKQLPDAKVWHLALQPGINQAGIFKNHDLRTEVQQTFLLELTNDEDTLLANMKDTTRRNVRVSGADISITNDPKYLKELHQYQKSALEKKGRAPACSFNFMHKMMDACIAHHSGALWVAKQDDKPQAIVWQIWDAKCSYYLMGSQNPGSSNYKAMSQLLWHAIKEAKKRGLTTFDLEGSMDEGVERFFRNFGGKRALYMVLHRDKSVRWGIKKLVSENVGKIKFK